MLENLAYLHYSCIYEHEEEGSEVYPKFSQSWVTLLMAVCACITTQPAGASPLLQYGDSGKLVVNLQNQLKQAGCLAQDAASDGLYGRRTRAAVKRLQRKNDLKLVDGIAGNETYATLAKDRTCKASGEGLKLGDRGEEVRLMQIQLNNWGFPIDGSRLEATGEFDLDTQKTLQKFEEYFGLKQDGILNAQDPKFFWISKKELVAKGKSLSRDEGIDPTEYRKSIRAMGASAVPYLTFLPNAKDRARATEGLGALEAVTKI